MQTKGNETSTRIRNSYKIAQKHSQQKGRPPRFRYQIFFMVTLIVALILVTKLQTVHLILEINNQTIVNYCNIEQDCQQANNNNMQLSSQLRESLKIEITILLIYCTMNQNAMCLITLDTRIQSVA